MTKFVLLREKIMDESKSLDNCLVNYVEIIDDKIFCQQCKEWQKFDVKEIKSKLISHKGQEVFGEYTCKACTSCSTKKIGYH